MDSLKSFVAHARSKGMDHQTIRMLLIGAGWKERDIAEALTAQSLDMPVPLPPDRGGAREAFLHLVNFAALTTGVISLVILYFTYINVHFPDPALERDVYLQGVRSTIRWSLAAVIVSYPLFLWITRFLLREMRAHTEKAQSAIRRWLTYLTLFVAAMAMMGDLIALISALLEGEVTIRFIFKVFVVLMLAGATFTYYFLSLRSSSTPSA